jgi:hypothetical protein
LADPNPYGFYYVHSISGAFSASQIGSAGNWRGHHNNGTRNLSIELVNPADFMTTYTNGSLASSGRTPVTYLDFVVNSSTQGRILGRSQDQRGAPSLVNPGDVEANDNDTIRRVLIDDMWFVVEASQLPILL